MKRTLPAIEITMTVAQLRNMAACGRRMLDYAKANDQLLIATLMSDDGQPVQIKLNRNCLKEPIMYDTS